MAIILWSDIRIHKEVSNSYREGTDQKLKSMALPYKTKVWQKMTKILTFGFFWTCQNLIGRASTKNCKLWLFHIKSRVEKKICPKFTLLGEVLPPFWRSAMKSFFPRSVRIDFSRSVIFDLFQRVLQDEINFFTKKWLKKWPKWQKNYEIFIKRSSVGHFGLVPS